MRSVLYQFCYVAFAAWRFGSINMKKSVALLLAVMLLISVFSLTSCQLFGGKKSEAAATEAAKIPEGLTPYSLNADGTPSSYYKNEYDDQNRLTRNYVYDLNAKLLTSTGYEYDQYGNEIRTIMYDADGEITSQIAWEKTKDGLVTKRSDINKDGEVTRVITTDYTDDGKEAEITEYDGSDKVVKKQTFEYDDDGELVRHTVYKGDAIEYYITYVKDSDGKYVEYKYDGDGNLITE